MGYALAEYLEDGGYTALDTTFSSYEAVCEVVAPPEAPQIVAIDGPTNSGKTSLTTALTNFYSERESPVSFLPLDYFLTDRDVRNGVFQALEAGEIDTSEYSHVAWEQYKYRACLLAAGHMLKQEVATTQSVVVPDAYDRLTGKKDQERSIAIPLGGILLTEGVGLHAYHNGLFDVRIRTDIQDDNSLLDRVLEREHQKPPGTPRLDDAYLEWRYNLVDAPHTSYLRDTSAGRADFVIDTTDFTNMVIYTKNNQQEGTTQ